jgi:apolipoprotein N-acyltransferase
MRKNPELFLSGLSGILLSVPWMLPGYGWVLFFALVPLLLAVHASKSRFKRNQHYSFIPALLTFLIWNLLSTWWISFVSFSGMALIVLLNAIIMSGVWQMFKVVEKRFQEISGFFSLIIFWLSFEFLQHHWDIPWPWLTLGNGFANSVRWIQWYEYTGVLGGSLWVLIVNILIYKAVRCLLEMNLKTSLRWSGFAVLAVVSPFLISLKLFSDTDRNERTINALILQPNIDPYNENF